MHAMSDFRLCDIQNFAECTSSDASDGFPVSTARLETTAMRNLLKACPRSFTKKTPLRSLACVAWARHPRQSSVRAPSYIRNDRGRSAYLPLGADGEFLMPDTRDQLFRDLLHRVHDRVMKRDGRLPSAEACCVKIRRNKHRIRHAPIGECVADGPADLPEPEPPMSSLSKPRVT